GIAGGGELFDGRDGRREIDAAAARAARGEQRAAGTADGRAGEVERATGVARVERERRCRDLAGERRLASAGIHEPAAGAQRLIARPAEAIEIEVTAEEA